MLRIKELENYPLNLFSNFILTFPSDLILDRHFLYNIEKTIKISEFNQTSESYTKKKLSEEESNLNFRRIPVALLRKYFYKKDLINDCLKFQTIESKQRIIKFMKDDKFNFNNNEKKYYKYSNIYLKSILDLILLSFEKSLHIIIWKLFKKEWFPLFNLFENLEKNEYWKGLFIPEIFKKIIKNKPSLSYEKKIEIILNSNHLIWFIMIWRMNSTLIIEKEIFGYFYSNSSSSLLCDEKIFKPLPKLKNFYRTNPNEIKEPNISCQFVGEEIEEIMENVRYNFLLFRDTHLSLLTSMFSKKIYNDINIIYNGMFRNNYPSCFNICCVEELPDMSSLLPLMNLFFDTGTKRESSEDLIDAIRHIFMVKPMNQICLVRNIARMLKHYYLKYPIVLELFKFVIKCVILGNLPYAKNPLFIMGRIYTNLMFNENDSKFFQNDSPSSPLNINELVLNWTKRCKYFSLFILREYLFYTCEISGIVDNILSRNYKWKSFKTFSRYGNSDVRKEISKQCSNFKNNNDFIDWDIIEKRSNTKKSSKNIIEKKTGIIVGFHTKTLEFSVKLNKNNFPNILSKKMRAVESSLDLSKLLYFFTDKQYKFQTSIFPENSPLFQIQKSNQQYQQQQQQEKEKEKEGTEKFFLNYEQFHFLCWCVAKRKRPILETKWLYLLNMTDAGIKTVKDWLFSYYEFSIPDNSFKEYTMMLYNTNPLDYLILKSYIKLIDFYNNDHIYHLPLQDSIYQFNAIRNTLRLESWEKTPSKAGYALLCRGCGRWANKITESYDRLSSKKQNHNNLSNNIKKQKKIKIKKEKKKKKKNKNDDDDDDDNNEIEESSFLDPLNEKINISKRPNFKKNKGKSNRNGYATYLSTSLLCPIRDNTDNCLYCKRAVFRRDYEFFDNSDIKKSSSSLSTTNTKKDFNSLFKGFYQQNDSDISSEEIPEFISNVSDFFENESNSENQNDDDIDLDFEKKNENNDNNIDNIDQDMLLGIDDVKIITDNPHKFVNIKIPDIIIENDENNNLSIYEYQIIHKPHLKNNNSKKKQNLGIIENEIEYDEFGFPIEKIILKNKLIKNKDSYTYDKNYNLPINNKQPIYHKLIGNKYTIHENQDNINNFSNITITTIISHIISQKFNCYNKLEYIDLVGIFYTFKNITFGLCTYCGCFIKVSNKNFSNRGITCGRHALSSYRFDHPLWQYDRNIPQDIKNEYLNKTRCISARKDEKWLALNNDKISRTHPFYNTFKNIRLIHLFDYRDIPSKYFNFPEATCYFCPNVKSFAFSTVYNFVFKIMKIPLCKMHTKYLKPKVKKPLISFQELELLIKTM